MSLELSLTARDTSPLNLVGAFCEVFWTPGNKLARRQCEKCVYVVRGIENNMVCLELIYDAIEGEHRNDHIYWVPIMAIQYLRVLSETKAQFRIDRLEREAMQGMPRD